MPSTIHNGSKELYRPPRAKAFCSEYRPPGDKSIAHRGILLASTIPGRSRLRGIPRSDDVKRTLAAVRALGVVIKRRGEEHLISPNPGGVLEEPEGIIQCGQSGTTMRLLAGFLAPSDFLSVLAGGGSLSRRPMGRVIEPLREMGAKIHGRGGDRYAPLVILGTPLGPIDYRMPVPSAQVKSSILMAALRGGVTVSIREGVRSRNHLEIMLREQGADIQVSGTTTAYRPGRTLNPIDMRIPGDPSSGAFFIVLALLVPKARIHVKDLLLNPTRTGFLDVLTRMGADIFVERMGKWNGEEVGDIVASSSELRPAPIRRQEVASLVDEVPVLAVAAARVRGEMDFPHLGELRVKESDRIAAIASNLRSIGVRVEERADGFTVEGTRKPLAGRVKAFGDHRIAMAFSVLGASPGVEIEVEGAECMAKSYPAFSRQLAEVAGAARRVGG